MWLMIAYFAPSVLVCFDQHHLVKKTEFKLGLTALECWSRR